MSDAALFRAVPTQPAAGAGTEVLLTLNAGSSSIKFALFDVDSLAPRLSGSVDGLGGQVGFKASSADGSLQVEHRWDGTAKPPADHRDALRWTIRWLREHLSDGRVVAVGHRVVHGGTAFEAPVAIDDAVMLALHKLVPLAPLHQPHNLAGIAAAQESYGSVPQVACFDTAFHRGMAFNEEAFALPRHFHAEALSGGCRTTCAPLKLLLPASSRRLSRRDGVLNRSVQRAAGWCYRRSRRATRRR